MDKLRDVKAKESRGESTGCARDPREGCSFGRAECCP